MPTAAVVIPARLESTRLPGKMLLSETGYPLVVHTAARAREAAAGSDGVITSVVVATDSARIAEEVGKHGFRAVMTSPTHPTGSDRLAEAAKGVTEDIIINLQGDEPEVAPSALLAALSSLLEAPDAAVATCAYPVDEKRIQEPALVKVVADLKGRAMYFSRAPIPFRRDDKPSVHPRALGHIGIYAYRKEALAAFAQLPRGNLEEMEALEQLRFLENGYLIKVSIVDSVSRGVDTEDDYRRFVSRYRESGRKDP